MIRRPCFKRHENRLAEFAVAFLRIMIYPFKSDFLGRLTYDGKRLLAFVNRTAAGEILHKDIFVVPYMKNVRCRIFSFNAHREPCGRLFIPI